MKMINNKIGVIFDDNHKKTYALNGIELLRATSWVAREDDGDVETKIETNVNHLETNPQIGVIGIESEGYLNSRTGEITEVPYKKGDKVFLHYLAYEWSDEKTVIPEGDCYAIDLKEILFKIEGDTFIMPPDGYLAKEIFVDPPKTESGIYLTSSEVVKSELKVIITHVPNHTNKFGRFTDVAAIGDTIITIDKYNYPVEIYGEKYIYIKENEIIGILN